MTSEMLFVTAKGMIKRTEGSEFVSVNKTIASTKLDTDDELVFVGPSSETEFVVLQTEEGYFLRFLQSEVSLLKKTAKGIKGIQLSSNDRVENCYLLQIGTEFYVEYKGKKVALNRLKLAKRAGKGNKTRV